MRKLVLELDVDNQRFWPDDRQSADQKVAEAINELMCTGYVQIVMGQAQVVDTDAARIYLYEQGK